MDELEQIRQIANKTEELLGKIDAFYPEKTVLPDLRGVCSRMRILSRQWSIDEKISPLDRCLRKLFAAIESPTRGQRGVEHRQKLIRECQSHASTIAKHADLHMALIKEAQRNSTEGK